MRSQKPGMPALKRAAAVAGIAGLLVWLVGCPDSGSSGGPVEVCAKAGQQCQLEGSQLGVCSMRPDGELFCMSQH